ncbi:MAG: glycosyltransferase [Pseudomonadota bacterium]|nr:glycosyltransferase [Pseudomonadota bacterium]
MRILHVIRSVNRVNGGPAEGVRQLMAATFALGQFPEVLTLDAPDDEWVMSFPGSIHAIGPVMFNYGYTGRLDRWLRRNARDYDALVVHGLWQFHGLAVWRALRGGPVPYFLYPHGMLDPWFKHAYPTKHLKKSLYWRLVESRVVNDAAAVLFTATEEASLAAQTFKNYRAKPAVIGYGIVVGDTARLGSAEAFAQARPETRGKRNVLFLGRLHPKKGGDLLIEAFAQAAVGDASLHLVMAGPDDGAGTGAAWKNLADRWGVADRITWTGMLAGDAKWSAIQAADVFALPSHQENFGIAVVEALALGVPVLISDKVNIWREIVNDGAGFAESDTLEGTVTALRRWLALDAEQRTLMKMHAVACYQQHFHMASAAQRLIDVVTPRTRHSHDAVTRQGLDSQP